MPPAPGTGWKLVACRTDIRDDDDNVVDMTTPEFAQSRDIYADVTDDDATIGDRSYALFSLLSGVRMHDDDPPAIKHGVHTLALAGAGDASAGV